jgi:chromosome segregation ATPase
LNLGIKDIQINQLNQEINSLNKQLEGAQRAKINANQECETLWRINDDLKAECDTARSGEVIPSLREEIASLKSKNGELNRATRTYNERINTLESEIKHERKATQAARTKFDSLQARVDKKDTSLHSANSELDVAIAEIKDLQIQIKTVVEEGVSDFQTVTNTRKNSQCDSRRQRPQTGYYKLPFICKDCRYPLSKNGKQFSYLQLQCKSRDSQTACA